MWNVLRLMAVGLKAGGSANIPTTSVDDMVPNLLNAVYFIIGFIAVGMIIFAGIKYLTANGEPGKAKKAMDTIIFSVVGLVIVIIAFALTNFIISRVDSGSDSGGGNTTTEKPAGDDGGMSGGSVT